MTALNKVCASARKLNAICDKAVTEIACAEHELSEANTGIAASIQVKMPDGSNIAFSYERYNGVFSFVITKDDNTKKLWSDWDRTTKMEAYTHLEELLHDMEVKIDALVQNYERKA